MRVLYRHAADPAQAPLKDALDLADPTPRMTSFSYTAINAQGLELRGQIEAPSVEAAREQLRAKGLMAQDLVEHASAGKAAKSRFKSVKPKSLQIFSRQFATMIEAGL